MGQITEKTGVTISADIPAEDADTKLNLLIASGQLPDIITTTNSTLIKDMIDADLVWPLQEFFETYLPDSHIINDSNASFPEDIKEQLILRDGDWYSFPSHILSAENREKWGLPDATREPVSYTHLDVYKRQASRQDMRCAVKIRIIWYWMPWIPWMGSG